ncbi:MAG: class I SAM-dependent methyltransferase [Christensenellales bacterium]|jgi:SAM-dependent methyltransferase
MSVASQKNQASWDAFADRYAARVHTQADLDALVREPARAFHAGTWHVIRDCLPEVRGARVLVPSSGDNKAVFAFAMLGARVTSADISQNQLANAARAAQQLGLSGIEFVRADTMTLDGIPAGEYDLVYTSNGVHVWIDDLDAMYQSIARVMRPGGHSVMYEIHPFNRPFDDAGKIVKPYDSTGPFEDNNEVTFAWRVMDILGAMLRAGLSIRRFEEMFAEKDYFDPFMVPLQAQVDAGFHEYDHAEVDRMHDWRENPMAALPQWLSVSAQKG